MGILKRRDMGSKKRQKLVSTISVYFNSLSCQLEHVKINESATSVTTKNHFTKGKTRGLFF